MVKYAQFDHTKPEPQPVTGWYDTGMHHYPNLPAPADLLALTDAQWDARLSDPSAWVHKGGALLAKPPPAPPALAKVTIPKSPVG